MHVVPFQAPMFYQLLLSQLVRALLFKQHLAHSSGNLGKSRVDAVKGIKRHAITSHPRQACCALPQSSFLLVAACAWQAAFQGSFAVRPLSSAAAASASSKPEGGKGAGGGKDAKGALAVEQEEFDAITDQIPQRPMGVVEGTSYTLLIAAGIAIAGLHLLAIHPYCLRQTWMQDRSRPPSATHQRR